MKCFLDILTIFIVGAFCSNWCWTVAIYWVCCCQHGWFKTSVAFDDSLS